MLDAFRGFDPNKLKPNLKMAVQRIQLQINKRTNAVKKDKREISRMLAEEKEEKARIRTEHVIRQDFHIGALEITQLFCELLYERMPLIVSEKNCPPDLEETICTLIWVSNRLEIAELGIIQQQLTKKYGPEFRDRALANQGGCVNDRVVTKLLVTPPTAFLVQQYLLEIAKEFNVDWVPSEPVTQDNPNFLAAPAPTGYSVPMAPASQYGNVYQNNLASSPPSSPPNLNNQINSKPFVQPSIPPPNTSTIYQPPPPYTPSVEPPYNPNQSTYQGPLNFPPPESTMPPFPPSGGNTGIYGTKFPGINPNFDNDEAKKNELSPRKPTNQYVGSPSSVPIVEAFKVEIEQSEEKNGEDDVPSLDELTKRFQDLRK